MNLDQGTTSELVELEEIRLTEMERKDFVVVLFLIKLNDFVEVFFFFFCCVFLAHYTF